MSTCLIPSVWNSEAKVIGSSLIRGGPSRKPSPTHRSCLLPRGPACNTLVQTAKPGIAQPHRRLHHISSYLAAPAPVSPFPASVLRIPATWASDWSSSQCTLSTPTTTPTISKPRYDALQLFFDTRSCDALVHSCPASLPLFLIPGDPSLFFLPLLNSPSTSSPHLSPEMGFGG